MTHWVVSANFDRFQPSICKPILFTYTVSITPQCEDGSLVLVTPNGTWSHKYRLSPWVVSMLRNLKSKLHFTIDSISIFLINAEKIIHTIYFPSIKQGLLALARTIGFQLFTNGFRIELRSYMRFFCRKIYLNMFSRLSNPTLFWDGGGCYYEVHLFSEWK